MRSSRYAEEKKDRGLSDRGQFRSARSQPSRRARQTVWIVVVVTVLFFYWAFFSPEQAITETTHLPVSDTSFQAGHLEDPGDIPVQDSSPLSPTINETAVIIFACNRPDYLERTLKSVLSYLPKGYHLYVSQDGTNSQVTKLVQDYRSKGVELIQHIDTAPVLYMRPGDDRFKNYYLIARHYGWGLSQMFDVRDYERVIILEDDLEIAPDFFNYMEGAAPLLDQDPTIWAISAWNDNGHERHVRNKETLYRTDFFPGLGWLMKHSLWRELGPIWPKAFWDDWMRRDDIREGRVTIRPEVSRTYTFGQIGASQGEYFQDHLKDIFLNKDPVDFKSKDLSFLTKARYDKYWADLVSSATPLNSPDEVASSPNTDVRLTYRAPHDVGFVPLANRFGLMADERSNVPRTAYQGVVVFWEKDHRVFLVPDSWSSKT
mmetsp:Transcript_3686/g.5597  ORF Transcript_3686/g.5597 Transcript_3686/m.5597 type:complete len:431 (+) Transcript_3686:152-1444(+)